MSYKNDDISSLSHTKWNCQYHIVFTPKYRRRVIFAKLRKIRKINEEIMKN